MRDRIVCECISRWSLIINNDHLLGVQCRRHVCPPSLKEPHRLRADHWVISLLLVCACGVLPLAQATSTQHGSVMKL